MAYSRFMPPLALRNPHVQTVAPNLFGPRRRLPPLASERAIFTTTDGAPLIAHIDWQPGPRDRSPTAVLIHGLEGNSGSSYMRGAAAKLLRAGWHVVRLNQRGCGESEALTPDLHHGGRSDDVAAVLTQLRAREGVDVLAAIGFSLGGSLVLRMLGQRGRVPGLIAAVALSPLLNPAQVQRHLDRPGSVVYRRFFLRHMAAHMRRRAALFPAYYPRIDYHADTVLEFDDRYTPPYIGHGSAREYYRHADALPLLPAIATPTLLLHAQDDPVVPFAGLDRAPLGAHVVGEFPRHGGHLGFYCPAPGSDGYWAEDRAVRFVDAALAAATRTDILAA
jgi:predicted alpha/beta-fold hydrolase